MTRVENTVIKEVRREPDLCIVVIPWTVLISIILYPPILLLISIIVVS